MTGKDARRDRRPTGKWKTRLSLLIGGLAVVAACLIVRHTWGPDSASAESPFRRRAAAKSSGKTRPVNATTPNRQPNQPKVVAVVNRRDISRQELATECLRRFGEDVLESLVNKSLILETCARRRITITREDIDAEIESLAKKFNLSVNHWLVMLRDERDIAPEQYRRDIIWPTLALRRLAADKLVVSGQELEKAFESEYGPKVKVRMITVSSRGKADRLHAHALANPSQFGTLAKEYSEDINSASTRGEIPPIRRHTGEPEVEQIVFGLTEGEISRVIHVANQYIIFQCENHLPATHIKPEFRKQAEQRLTERIRDGKLRAAATDVFKQLQEGAKVVNVYNDPDLRRQMRGVAAMINGQKITTRHLAEECIARHGAEVLELEIDRELLQQALKERELTVAERDIDAEIARAAETYGHEKPDGSPDIDRWLKRVTQQDGVTVELYVRDAVWPTVALKKLVGGSIRITDADMKKGFEANYGPRVDVLAIVLANQRRAQEVWEMAKNNRTEEFFGELAHQYSVEPVSKANYGQVPPIQRHGGQPLLEKEAFGLRSGELSSVIAAGGHFIILHCRGRTKPVVTEFEAVREELYKDLHEKKLRIEMAKAFEALKEAAQIDNFLAGTSQAGKRRNAAPLPPGGTATGRLSPNRRAGPAARRSLSTTRRK